LLTRLAIDPILSDPGIGQAFPELRCTFDGRSIVPDVVVFEEANIAYEDNGDIQNVFSIPPDWTIEILSHEQSTTKVLKNINHCLAYGTQMGWLIDPTDRSVFVLVANQALQILEEPSAILPVPAFAAAILQGRGYANELTVEKLFSWIKKAPSSDSPAQ
jgi:Uma2 family endonuclease